MVFGLGNPFKTPDPSPRDVAAHVFHEELVTLKPQDGEEEEQQSSSAGVGLFSSFIDSVNSLATEEEPEAEEARLQRELASLTATVQRLEQEALNHEAQCVTKERMRAELAIRRDALMAERATLQVRMLEGEAWRHLGGRSEDAQPQSSLARAVAALVAAHSQAGRQGADGVVQEPSWDDEDKVLRQVKLLEIALHNAAATVDARRG